MNILVVLAILLGFAIGFAALKWLTRPKFRKGEWVWYKRFGDYSAYRGQILTHDNEFVRHWAIKRLDGSVTWVYEGDIGKE